MQRVAGLSRLVGYSEDDLLEYTCTHHPAPYTACTECDDLAIRSSLQILYTVVYCQCVTVVYGLNSNCGVNGQKSAVRLCRRVNYEDRCTLHLSHVFVFSAKCIAR